MASMRASALRRYGPAVRGWFRVLAGWVAVGIEVGEEAFADAGQRGGVEPARGARERVVTMRRSTAATGSAAFFVVAPGTVVGVRAGLPHRRRAPTRARAGLRPASLAVFMNVVGHSGSPGWTSIATW